VLLLLLPLVVTLAAFVIALLFRLMFMPPLQISPTKASTVTFSCGKAICCSAALLSVCPLYFGFFFFC